MSPHCYFNGIAITNIISACSDGDLPFVIGLKTTLFMVEFLIAVKPDTCTGEWTDPNNYL